MTAVNLSDTFIANMALMRIGSGQIIQSFTDGSAEAQQLSVWYFANRDAVLTDWPWPFASKYTALTQVSTTGIPPNPEWLYSYRYPADCLSVRRIVNGAIVTNSATTVPATTVPNTTAYSSLAFTRADGNPLPYPFEIGSDTIGRLVYTDAPTAWIKYTYDVQDATLYSPDFADLLAWRVALDLYALSRSDHDRQVCIREHERAMNRTRARFANESQNDQPQIAYNAESVRARYTDVY